MILCVKSRSLCTAIERLHEPYQIIIVIKCEQNWLWIIDETLKILKITILKLHFWFVLILIRNNLNFLFFFHYFETLITNSNLFRFEKLNTNDFNITNALKFLIFFSYFKTLIKISTNYYEKSNIYQYFYIKTKTFIIRLVLWDSNEYLNSLRKQISNIFISKLIIFH